MKLAILGVAAIAVGVALGVDGLALAGGVWVVGGSTLWVFWTRRQDERRRRRAGDPAVDALQPGLAPEPGGLWALAFLLVLAIGLASLAIGLLEVGFEDGEAWRWVPVAVGALVTLIALLGAIARLSGVDPETGRGGRPLAPATITIEGKRETGVYVNERPRIEFDLLVEPEGHPAYRVKKKATVPHTALSDIGVGDGFAARVDPGDEDRIEIDWSAPVEGGGDPAARLERLDELRRRGLIDDGEYEAQRRRIIGSV